MSRTLKIYVSGAEQGAAAEKLDVVERYDAFLLVEASGAEAKRLSRDFLTEDVTDLYTISVGGRTIDTSRPRIGADGAVRPHQGYRGVKAPGPGPHHYLVQFIGPIKESWLRGVKRAGGEPREPWGDFTYIVRANKRALVKMAALRYVRWIGDLPHQARLSRVLRDALQGQEAQSLPRTRLLADAYTVEFFGRDDAKRALPAMRKAGADIVEHDPKHAVVTVRLTGGKAAQRKALTALSMIHGVKKIRQRVLSRPANNVATGIMETQQAMATSASGLGLSGKGEIIAICDTGLDTGDPATIHPDLAGRVIGIKSYPIAPSYSKYVKNPGGNDGASDVNEGHGTHVAGSVLGSGVSSNGLPGVNGLIRGCAYEAKLFFQAVEQTMSWKNPSDQRSYGRYMLAGLPDDLTVVFTHAYAQGARIHSNSWGGGDPGAYDYQCQALDAYVWAHPDFCILFAAGNDGTDSDGNGKINPTSVTPPATAKNCITVGACESLRPEFDSETYGAWWPKDYPAAPYKNDAMADNPKEVVAFSSRGPTHDKRNKPDVVAPGTFILSTRSTMIAANNTAWAPLTQSRLYFYMGGTSMATPLTAGAVALLRQYLRTQQKIASPTAALLKAALIAGAVRIPSFSASAPPVDDAQGYGRVDLDAVVAPSPRSASFLEVKPGLRTGEIHSVPLKVRSSTKPLRIVLAYSDYPGASLVNNLNLIVTGPDGRKHVGNRAASSSAPATLDAENNVEVVHLPSPKRGDWRIDVVGGNVPHGPQPFALVTLAVT